MVHPFGKLLRSHLSRLPGLTQAKLANGIEQPASVIAAMAHGHRLTGSQARNRVIAVIHWFHKQGLLTTRTEADALLEAAGMAGLGTGTPAEDEEQLIHILGANVASRPSSTPPNTLETTSMKVSTEQAPVIFGSSPRLPSLFIGREDDVRAIKQRLLTSSNTVQALTAVRGWPGVGKTTLASALVHDPEIAQQFPDGVLWASLGQQPSLFAELAAWGRALGISMVDVRSIEEASARLSALLINKRMLLIIDDVWEAQHAQPFRVGGSQCALLCTTRLPEVAQKIALPQDVYILGVLSQEHALELLRTLAPEVVAQNPEASAELVSDLEGLPLALLVAGHLLHTEASYGFGVEQLLGELREGARLIVAQAPADRTEVSNETTPTVAALLKKSTDLLDPHTLDCFAYLGAFAPKPATFDAAAMRSVWQVDDPRPTIRTLVNRGLLEPSGNQRFWMHALLVAHARTLLTDSYPALLLETVPQKRHTYFYLQVSIQVHDLYLNGGDNVYNALALFDSERAQIDAGWNWIRRHSSSRERDELLITYTGTITYIIDLRYSIEERISQCKEMLLAAQRLGRQDIIANSLDLLGIVYSDLGNYALARNYHEQALALRYSFENSHGVGATLCNLGLVATYLGNFAEARSYYEQALQFVRQINDRRLEENILGNLGIVAFNTKDYSSSEELYLYALQISREIGDIRNEGIVLGQLGLLYQVQEGYQEAINCYEQALEITRLLGDIRSEGRTLGNLGLVYSLVGETSKAINYHHQQLAIAEAVDDQQGIAKAKWNLGFELVKQGNSRHGILLMEDFVEFLQTIGHAEVEKFKVDLDNLNQLLHQELLHPNSSSTTNIALNITLQRAYNPPILIRKNLLEEDKVLVNKL